MFTVPFADKVIGKGRRTTPTIEAGQLLWKEESHLQDKREISMREGGVNDFVENVKTEGRRKKIRCRSSNQTRQIQSNSIQFTSLLSFFHSLFLPNQPSLWQFSLMAGLSTWILILVLFSIALIVPVRYILSVFLPLDASSNRPCLSLSIGFLPCPCHLTEC